MTDKHVHTAEDGITRCSWAKDQLDYRNYHDVEWGRPVSNDFQLFEKICLEGFQSGLSWLTILRKRENLGKHSLISTLTRLPIIMRTMFLNY